MYHELLMALMGYTGDVFQYDGLFIKVTKDLQVPLLHPSDLMIMDEILEVASLYKKLQMFLEPDVHTSFSELSLGDGSERVKVTIPKKKVAGLYVNSLCSGIREILEEYKNEVATLEMDILKDPYMTVTTIRTKIEPYRSLFQALDGMLLKLQGFPKSSSLIVEIVKTEHDLNVHLQDTFKRLIPWVNRILYDQIMNWVSFGKLHDPQDEFFIKQLIDKEKDVSGSLGDESFAGGDTGVSYEYLVGGRRKKKRRDKFYVDYTKVPSHFPVELTDRILHVGSSIVILSQSEKMRNSVVYKQQEYYDILEEIPLEAFDTEELSYYVGKIAEDVGRDLRRLVVIETDLPKHLAIIKDFFLTGRGELFHDFILNIKSIPLVKNTLQSDLERAFALAASRVQVQEETLQRIRIQLSSDISKPTLPLVMNSISLQMEDEWPLHILFTPESLLKYNELFRFLLQVRLLQIELNRLWLETRRVFRFPVPQGPAELRNVMSYFIDHLQHYLQEDVLENQYAILTNVLEKSEDFDEVLVGYASFQSNILAQSFRTSKQLSHFLDEIMKVCTDYAAFITNHIQHCEAKDLPFNEGISKEVSGFSMDFKRHMDLLLNLLKNAALKTQCGQYLGQFLLRLDFNSYFSSIISGYGD